MKNQTIDRERGKRIAKAMEKHGMSKAMALAAELDVSEAAVSKWKHGHTMSLENACMLASKLDVSLDWLLMGRNIPEWLEKDQLGKYEIELLEQIQQRPIRVVKILLAILVEIPETLKRD